MNTAPESAEERRRHRRYTCVSEVWGERITPAPAGPLKMTVSNICRNGVMMHTNHGIFLARGYEIKLTFSGDDTRNRIDVRGRVVWIHRHRDWIARDRWSLGVSFDAGQDGEVNKLCELAGQHWNGSDE